MSSGNHFGDTAPEPERTDNPGAARLAGTSQARENAPRGIAPRMPLCSRDYAPQLRQPEPSFALLGRTCPDVGVDRLGQLAAVNFLPILDGYNVEAVFHDRS